jgi:alanine racemase
MPSGWVEVDLEAIAHNFREIKRSVGDDKKIMPVIKADAYGHGLVPVARVLEEKGADFLAVSYVEEGIILRRAGIKIPIVILLGILPEEIEALFIYRLIPIIYRLEIARKLSQEAQKRKTQISVFVKVDTGMGRLGVFYKEAISFLKEVNTLPGLKIEGITSHLALAESDRKFTQKQLMRFKAILKAASQAGLILKFNHIANSTGALMYNVNDFSVIRPGLALYGIYPIASLQRKIDLKPAMSFKTRIIYVKWLPPGVGVSYGHTYVTTKKTKVAIIPVGYDQGLFRQLSNKGEVLVQGKRVPIIGTICMHLTMLDVTSIDKIDIGEEVVILGKQGNEEITADEIASKAGTISYDVLCRFGRSNPRIYKKFTR